MPRRLEVEIVADAAKFAKGIKEAETRTSRFSKAAGIAGGAIVGGLVVGLKKSVDAAKEAQVSQQGMETQLKALGISYGKHATQIEGVIQKTSKLAAIDDEDLQDAFTRLVRQTGNVNKALKDTEMAANLSRGAHISLTQATKAVTAAEQGRSTALRRLGIDIPKVNDAQVALKAQIEEFRKTHKHLTDEQKVQIEQWKTNAKELDRNKTSHEALAAIQQKFGGAAEAYGKTAAGAQERFQVALENVQESLGKGLLPILTAVMNQVANFTAFLSEHTNVAKVLVGVIGALGVALVAVSVAEKIAKIQALELNLAFLANPIVLVIASLAALGVAFVIVYKKSETFRNIVTGTWNAIKGGAEAVLDFFRGNWKTIAVLISGPFAVPVALATNAFGIRSALVGAFTTIKNFVSGTVTDIVGFVTGIPGRLAGVAGALGNVFGTLGHTLAALLKAPINAVIRLWNDLGIPAFKIHIPGPGPLPDINFSTPAISLPDIPQLAMGGIVRRPTLAMLAEQGPEAVVPLGRGGFGGPALHVENLNVTSPALAEMVAARVMARLAYG